MLNRRQFAAALPTLCAAGARAQEAWPTRPVTVITGFPAGGLTDVLLRASADTVRERLGQPMLIENRPGMAGTIALRQVGARPGDGYTLGVLTSASVINQHIREAGYDTDRDFTPILMWGQTRFGLVVPNGSRFRSVKELVDAARAAPDTIRYSSSGIGSPQHLTMVRLGHMAGVKWIHVPYRNGIDAAVAVERGEVDASPSATEFVLPVQQGRMKLLAAFGAERMPEFPEVPTAREQGYDLVSFSFFGVVGPRDMPAPVVDKLHGAFRDAMADRRFENGLNAFGMVRDYRDPQQFRRFIAESNRMFGDLVRQVQLKVTD